MVAMTIIQFNFNQPKQWQTSNMLMH